MEKVISMLRPRVYHLNAGGVTLCGQDAVFKRRVRMGQKGDGLPCCAACAKKEDAADAAAKPTKGGV